MDSQQPARILFPATYQRILLPLDGSALALEALPHAIAHAKHLGPS